MVPDNTVQTHHTKFGEKRKKQIYFVECQRKTLGIVGGRVGDARAVLARS
jgi:hypothetical protein